MQFSRPITSCQPQLADPRLMLITDDQGRSAQELEAIILQAVEGGVTMVQYREKSLAPEKSFEIINTIAAALAQTEVPLLINSDILETLSGVPHYDGIHYTSRGWMRRSVPDGRIVGWSTHSAGEVTAFTLQTASYITLSPIYNTPSKSGIIENIGLSNMRKLLYYPAPVPVVALGGIDITNAADCILAGTAGIAVMRAIMSAMDPRAAAAELRTAVDSALEATS